MREWRILEAGLGLKLDYTALEQVLKKEPESRALDVLRHQLTRYKKVIPGMFLGEMI